MAYVVSSSSLLVLLRMRMNPNAEYRLDAISLPRLYAKGMFGSTTPAPRILLASGGCHCDKTAMIQKCLLAMSKSYISLIGLIKVVEMHI